jgi:hypothetical protein
MVFAPVEERGHLSRHSTFAAVTVKAKRDPESQDPLPKGFFPHFTGAYEPSGIGLSKGFAHHENAGGYGIQIRSDRVG